MPRLDVPPLVPPRTPEPPIDYGMLADYLTALAYHARLELLDVLRTPHTLSEIRLTPRRGLAGDERPRPAARQTVQGHLDKLVEADLVRTEEIVQEGRTMPRYIVNPPRLYALMEELRRLSVLRARTGAPDDVTGTLGSSRQPRSFQGPRLVLVHGVYEGQAYPLQANAAHDGRWVIGRSRDAAVSLDYDPFVSTENSAITGEPGDYHLIDLPGSKNGTRVNWEPLPAGGSRPLRSGDVVGVGRSLLCFAAD